MRTAGRFVLAALDRLALSQRDDRGDAAMHAEVVQRSGQPGSDRALPVASIRAATSSSVGVEIAARTSLIAGPGATLQIGDNVFIGGLCLIAASRRIVIGSESMLAEFVTIRDHDHDPSNPPRAGRILVGEVLIGERVWVGAKATIVRRCATIGDDVVIGANALVNRPVPAGCLAGGVPAVIRRRPREKDGA